MNNPKVIITSRTLLAVHLLIGVIVSVLLCLIITYTLTLTLGHVDRFICLISHTGNFPPESCIFSLLMSLTSVVYSFIVYIRFLQVSHALGLENLSETNTKKMEKYNLISLLLGLSGSFGWAMTGCFQHRVFNFLHVVGVALCSFGTYLYFCFQVFFSFRVKSLKTSNCIKGLRTAVIVCSGIFLLMASGLLIYFWTTSKCGPRITLSFKPETDRREIRDFGVVVEWIFFTLYKIMLLTFYSDFKKVAILKDQIVILN